jgi:hypothetical protein
MKHPLRIEKLIFDGIKDEILRSSLPILYQPSLPYKSLFERGTLRGVTIEQLCFGEVYLYHISLSNPVLAFVLRVKLLTDGTAKSLGGSQTYSKTMFCFSKIMLSNID